MSDYGELLKLACPTCGQRGTLQLGERLVARPLGIFSLAGTQMKVSATAVPVIECVTEECDFVKFPSN